MQSSSNRGLSARRLCCLYFFYFAFLGSHGPYIAAILKDRGLSATELSSLMAVLPLLTIVAPPLWAGLADRLRARARVLSIVLFGAAAGCSAFLAIDGIWSGLAVVLLYGFFRSPVITLCDALTHAFIYPKLEQFGRIRLWGSVGFIFGSVLIGQLRTILPDSTTQLISASFLITAGFLVLKSKDPMDQHESEDTKKINSNAWYRGLKFMLEPSALLIAFGNLFHAMGHSSFDAYFALFAQAHGVGDHIIGFGWGIGVTAEVVVMRFAPDLLRNTPPSKFMILGAGAAVTRWSMMYLLNDPIVSLWLQPLHALTFGLWYLAFSNWLQNRVPSDIRATCQGLFLAVMSIGMASGNFIGGRVIDAFDVRTVYLVAVIPASISLILYSFNHRYQSNVAFRQES